MEDIRMIYSIIVSVTSILIAWYINHYLLEKKRLADRRENINKQTSMMLQAAKNFESLSVLIDEELDLENQSEQADGYVTARQQTLSSLEKICNRIPYQIVVDAKKKLCAEAGIELEYENEVEKDWYLNGMDMVVIVGNLLDNAIESCLQKIEQPKIHMTIIQKMNQVSLTISNTKAGKSKNGDISRYSTTKQNRLLHGYGLENVQEIVKKHYGTLKIADENQWFTVKIEMECEG